MFKQIPAPLDQLPGVTGLGSEQYATRRVERTYVGLWAMRGSKRRNTGGVSSAFLPATVAFLELVHVAFLAPLGVRRKSPVDLAPVVSAASLVGASRKSASRQRGSVIGHYVTKQENCGYLLCELTTENLNLLKVGKETVNSSKMFHQTESEN